MEIDSIHLTQNSGDIGDLFLMVSLHRKLLLGHIELVTEDIGPETLG